MNVLKLISLLRRKVRTGLGRRALLPLAAMLVAALALSACGGSDDTTSAGGGGETAASTEAGGGSATSEEEGEDSEEGDEETASGYVYGGSEAETAEAKKEGAATAKGSEKAPSGKSIGVILLSGESASSVQVAEAAERVGDLFGYSVNVCDPHLEEQKFAECGTSILAQNPSVIFSVSTNASAFGSAVKDAAQQGIPWFNTNSAITPSDEINDYGIDGLALTQASDEFLFEAMRERSGGDGDKLKLFAITAPTVGIANLNAELQLKKDAAKAGDIELIIHNLDLANIAQDTLTSSRQTLEQNPDLAGMWTSCDFCVPLMAQAVASYPEAGEVAVAGEFSTPQTVAGIRKGSIAGVADYAWALPVWAGMDQVLGNWTRKEQIKQGFDVFKSYPLPFMEPYVLDKENVGASGPVPFFGPNFEAFFEEKWGKEFGVG